MRFLKLTAVLIIILLLGNTLQDNILQAQEKVSPGSKIVNELKFEPIKWNVPKVGKEVKRYEFKNGMIGYFSEDHTLPLINVLVMIKTGAIYQTKSNYGTAGLTQTVLRTGGTKSYTPEALNKELEYLGASVESVISSEVGTVVLNILSKDFDKGLKILSEVLMYPEFSESQLTLAKSQVIESIKRRKDSPGDIAVYNFCKIIYPDHPYGWDVEEETIKNISRNNIIGWYKTFFHPNNIMMGISGDFKTDDMIKKLEDAFGSWQKAKLDLSEVVKVKDNFYPGVYLIEKDVNQSYIRLGHLGIKRGNPDKYALELLNCILGGKGLINRLFLEVREKEGLAYSVGSTLPTDSQDLDVFAVVCQTKSSSTHKAIDIILKEIEKVKTVPVSDEELKNVKESFANSFVFDFSSTSSILNAIMGLEYVEYPSDYYEKYLDNIRKVTKEDILSSAQKYLHLDKLSFIIVGNSKDFDKSLDDLGKVTIIGDE